MKKKIMVVFGAVLLFSASYSALANLYIRVGDIRAAWGGTKIITHEGVKYQIIELMDSLNGGNMPLDSERVRFTYYDFNKIFHCLEQIPPTEILSCASCHQTWTLPYGCFSPYSPQNKCPFCQSTSFSAVLQGGMPGVFDCRLKQIPEKE